MAATSTGPIAGGKRGQPFGATIADLDAAGYLEQEYFFSGVAPRYRPVGELGGDGRWAAERAGESSFATRAVVRRPLDPDRFNGTVVVEWNNVSAGLEIFEAGDTPVIFDEGFAYVGVSAQYIGIEGFAADPHGLRGWDPERYEALYIPDDALSYGVFGEVARACGPDRRAMPADPLGGLGVRRLIAIGGSQSAGRLVTYLNAIQPLERTFDAFLPFTWFGSGFSLDDPTPLDLSTGGLNGLLAHPTRIRTDLGVPVFVVNSECETLCCAPVRQPDTDTFRFWEVAGAPHAPRLHLERITGTLQRDGVALPGSTEGMMLSPVAWAPVLDAALGHLQRWLVDGAAPPSHPPIELAGTPAAIRRDDDGNALGGARVPEHEASRTRNTGAIEEAGAGGLMGACAPLPAHRLRERYADQVTYLSRFDAAADAAVAAGVLRPRDADDSKSRARATPFG